MVAVDARAATWSTPTEISSAASGDITNLSIDANSQGELAAAWRYRYTYLDGATEKHTYGIAALRSSFGGAIGSPTLFDGTPTHGVTNPERWAYQDPSISIGENNLAVVAFQSRENSSYGVFSALADSGATTFTPEHANYGPTSDLPVNGKPLVAVNSAGNALLFRSAGKYQYGFATNKLQAELLTNPGTLNWASSALVTTTDPEDHERAIATAPDGSAAGIVITANGIGARWIQPILIESDGALTGGSHIWGTTSGVAASQPVITRTPDGGVIAAFVRGDNGGGDPSGVFVTSYAKSRAGQSPASASTWERVSILHGGTADGGTRPRLVSDASGNTMIAWVDPASVANGGYAIRARFRPAGSSSWGPAEVVASNPQNTGSQFQFDIAMDSAGAVTAAYLDGADNKIKSTFRPSTGGWSAPTTISGSIADPNSPDVAIGANSQAFVAFAGEVAVGAGSDTRAFLVQGDPTPTPAAPVVPVVPFIPFTPTPTPTPKSAAPKLPKSSKIKLASKQSIGRVGKKGKVNLTFSAREGGVSLKAKLTVTAKVARKLKLIKRGKKAVTVGTAKLKIKKSGKTKLTIKLTKKAKRAFKKARKNKSVKLRLVLTFDKSGTKKTLKKTIKLKR